MTKRREIVRITDFAEPIPNQPFMQLTKWSFANVNLTGPAVIAILGGDEASIFLKEIEFVTERMEFAFMELHEEEERGGLKAGMIVTHSFELEGCAIGFITLAAHPGILQQLGLKT
jgi:hypothetical protein